MADKEKRSLREFLRHINDYTYRFNPEKGQFRYRELRARCFATSGSRPI